MAKQRMVINYVPGEECRVAVVENGRLEELHAERMDGPSNHVGSIYVGRVENVEPGIQAAFVDFGLEANGFLHTSDIHPQYFPGEDSDTTERVGKKTRRSERPPIQDCLRRGDEVAVQVLKEGVGTKGPTVTSYLSIPGRFLVMMPQMDRVGVSRKVEDEEMRRKMRDILDQLDLPEGFGFILRTAGFDRTKAELKRDLAYLMRLWKDMETRWKSGSKPRLLYSESDLLVRALRDMLTGDIEEIVIDNEAALNRAARFLKIVSPRTSTRLVHYTGRTPIFHAMGIEREVQMIHAREVPLPSGGRLVIDETEALVAIDVNSGKMRDARDAETTAYKTNIEAADEICRQLRLRDLGGVIANDFIDMRQLKHRRELETRMRDNLKLDRARWTIAPVSEFGILEMTRQRMRGSHESQHFAECPTCRGRGLVQRPDSVAAESLRDLTALLDHSRVARVEMVVHSRLAGELLSTRRKALSRIERASGKHVDVRVSEAIGVDRVTFYAYDDRGADVDVSALSEHKLSDADMKVYEIKADSADASENWATEPEPAAVEDLPEAEEIETSAELHPIEIEPTTLREYAERPSGRPQGPQGGHGHGQVRGGHDGRRPGNMNSGYQEGPQQHGQQQGGQDQFAEGEGSGGRRRGRRRRGRGGRGQGGQYGHPGQHGHSDHGHAPHAGNGYGPYDHADGRMNQGPGPSEQLGSDQFASAGDDGVLEAGTSGNGYGNAPYADGGYGQGQYEGDAQGEQNYNSAQFDQNGAPLGDSGAPGYGQEMGEGGPRRRRRRRGRGGRGRGGRGHGGPQGYMDGSPMQGDQYGAPGHVPQGGYDGAGVHQQGYEQPGYQQQGYDQEGNGQHAHGQDESGYVPQQGDGQFDQLAADHAQHGPDGHAEQVQFDEYGHPLPPMNAGEGGGGPRRRRRRRRGRGGRGGQSSGQPHGMGGGMPGGAMGSHEPGHGQPAPGQFQGRYGSAPSGGGPYESQRDYSEQGEAHAPQQAGQIWHGQGEEAWNGGDSDVSNVTEQAGSENGAPESDGLPDGGGENDGQGAGDAGAERPRRRRGGRGRGRGKGSGPAAPDQSPKEAGGRESRSPRGGSRTEAAAPKAEPAPSKPIPAKPAAKPRSLYSSRRKLGPGDIKGIAKARD